MPGLLDNLRKMVGLDDEEYEEDYFEEDIQVQRKNMRQTPAFGLSPTAESEREKIWEAQPRVSAYTPPAPVIRTEKENVVPMSRGSETLKVLTQRFKIVVIEPKSFEDCPKLVDSLKSRKPIIINLEMVETDTARKIFDFLSGATYAVSGNVQRISNNIFVFLPENVDVSTNTDGSKGMDFGTAQAVRGSYRL